MSRKKEIPQWGETEPTEWEKKNCYVETFSYKGYDVDIFADDNGQCFYCYMFNECYTFGTYTPLPFVKEDIMGIIDRKGENK